MKVLSLYFESSYFFVNVKSSHSNIFRLYLLQIFTMKSFKAIAFLFSLAFLTLYSCKTQKPISKSTFLLMIWKEEKPELRARKKRPVI